MEGNGLCFQGVDKKSTAYKLLSQMGWEEGQGLGAQKQGIKSHVRVRKKADASGVGAAQARSRAGDWTLQVAAYDRVLAALKVVAEPVLEDTPAAANSPSEARQQRRHVCEETEVWSSPEWHPANSVYGFFRPKETRNICGCHLCSGPKSFLPQEKPAKRRKRSRPGQRAHQECSAAEQCDAAIVTCAPAPAIPLAEPRRKLATHVGRFKRAAAGKRVHGYSPTDLAAILGGCKSEAAVDRATAAAAGACESFPPAAEPEPASEASDEPETGSVWWTGRFVQAGRRGAFGHELASAPVPKALAGETGFSEADQANLWHSATGAQSKSHQGLGRASGAAKVGGARWAGSRKTFGDGSSGSEDEEGGQGMGPARLDAKHAELDGDVDGPVVLPSRIQQAARDACNGTGSGDAAASAAASGEGEPRHRSRVKWRKIAKRILEASPAADMPLRQLRRLAWAAAVGKGATDRKRELREMMRVLSSSKQFVCDSRTVRLRT